MTQTPLEGGDVRRMGAVPTKLVTFINQKMLALCHIPGVTELSSILANSVQTISRGFKNSGLWATERNITRLSRYMELAKLRRRGDENKSCQTPFPSLSPFEEKPGPRLGAIFHVSHVWTVESLKATWQIVCENYHQALFPRLLRLLRLYPVNFAFPTVEAFLITWSRSPLL